jgi:hypothetical protein
VTADKSLENKVDQLWQTILTPLFPFHQGYMIFCHDRVRDKRVFLCIRNVREVFIIIVIVVIVVITVEGELGVASFLVRYF